MLRPDGYVKVLDFGLAKLTVSGLANTAVDGITRSVMETNPGVVLGTFSYMSPEQARGGTVDARSDIFSLGVMLYEMVAGRLPFTGATPADVLGAILYVEALPLSDVSSAPDTLVRVVGQAMSKRSEARHQTMDGLVADLKAVRRQIELLSIGSFSSSPADSAVSVPPDSGTSRRVQSSGSGPVAGSGVGTRAEAAPARKRRARRTVDSLAVLPLANASQDPEMEYLSDGITDSIINTLSQLPKLRVMARSTVFRYKGRPQEPQEIGRALDVRAVLTGRVLQRGDTLTIGAELVDVDDGSQIWGGQFHRRMSGIFELQEEIADEMTDKLRLKLTGDQKKRLARPATREVEAYQAYLKGRFLVNKRTAESCRQSDHPFRGGDRERPWLRGRIRRPGRNLCPQCGDRPRPDCPARGASARESSSRPRARARRSARRGARAGRVSEISLRLGLGRRRARVQARSRAQSGPCAFASLVWNVPGVARPVRRSAAGNAARAAARSAVAGRGERHRAHPALCCRFDEAIARYRHVIQMDPTFTRVWFDLALTLIATGAYDEAFQELKKVGDQPFALLLTSIGDGLRGHRDSARAALARLEDYHRAGKLGSDELALVYAAIGESRRASELLARACEESAPALAYAAVEPVMEFLRSDAECRPVLERAGIIAPVRQPILNARDTGAPPAGPCPSARSPAGTPAARSDSPPDSSRRRTSSGTR